MTRDKTKAPAAQLDFLSFGMCMRMHLDFAPYFSSFILGLLWSWQQERPFEFEPLEIDRNETFFYLNILKSRGLDEYKTIGDL